MNAAGPNLRALHAERRQGRCIACDCPLSPSPTRERVVCGDPECRRVYMQAAHRDYRLRKKRTQNPQAGANSR